jgi:hypothetical protein
MYCLRLLIHLRQNIDRKLYFFFFLIFSITRDFTPSSILTSDWISPPNFFFFRSWISQTPSLWITLLYSRGVKVENVAKLSNATFAKFTARSPSKIPPVLGISERSRSCDLTRVTWLFLISLTIRWPQSPPTDPANLRTIAQDADDHAVRVKTGDSGRSDLKCGRERAVKIAGGIVLPVDSAGGARRWCSNRFKRTRTQKVMLSAFCNVTRFCHPTVNQVNYWILLKAKVIN